MSKGNEPAFLGEYVDGYGITQKGEGLSKRELFAAMAMQGMLAAERHTLPGEMYNAVEIADALLAALSAKDGQGNG